MVFPPEEEKVFSPFGAFRERRRFEEWAQRLIRLPEPGEEPGGHLLPEDSWRQWLRAAPEPDDWLAALSQATGVYFFPSREWPPRLVRYLKLLKVKRLLEAGAGRGYVSAALAPLCLAAGLAFQAVDKGEGEFVSGLPGWPLVACGDVFQLVREFQPEAVLYAWPPPGQSLAPLLQLPSLRYLIVIGEGGGGVTGAREDWQRLPHRKSFALSRYARGRSGEERHQATIFYK